MPDLCRNCFTSAPLNPDGRCGTCVGEMIHMRVEAMKQEMFRRMRDGLQKARRDAKCK